MRWSLIRLQIKQEEIDQSLTIVEFVESFALILDWIYNVNSYDLLLILTKHSIDFKEQRILLQAENAFVEDWKCRCGFCLKIS